MWQTVVILKICCAQVGELTLAVARLNNEKVMLEQSMEMEEEGIVNKLQRVIETVMARNKVFCTHTLLRGPSLPFQRVMLASL